MSRDRSSPDAEHLVPDLRRRLAWAMYLGCALAAYSAVVGSGVERLIWGPVAVGLGGFIALTHTVGRPIHSVARWFFGVVGAVLIPAGALVCVVVGTFLVMALGEEGAGYVILLAMVALPVALGCVAWGWVLVQAALADPSHRRAMEIDVDAARASAAVRRFDAMHGPASEVPDEAGDE